MLNTQKTSFVYDRRKQAMAKGRGTVEIRVCLSRKVTKYFPIGHCAPDELEGFTSNPIYIEQAEKYDSVARAMEMLGEEMTIENFNRRIGIARHSDDILPTECRNLIEYFENDIETSKIAEGTKRQRRVTLEALKKFGKIRYFSDFTPLNLTLFDKWLREPYLDDRGDRHRTRPLPGGKKAKTPRRMITRSDICVHNYHRHLHTIVKGAMLEGLLKSDPYALTDFPRGECKEKKPLFEHELKELREVELCERLDRVRDLFIFSSYTGLSYCDVMAFDYATMTKEVDGMRYIDGSRIKTGATYFTPILPPAQKVLEKYDYDLPAITNEKLNVYLHEIEHLLSFKTHLTFHLARHTFGTLLVNKDVPYTHLAKMMGHKNIRITQLYGKSRPLAVIRHASVVSQNLL